MTGNGRREAGRALGDVRRRSAPTPAQQLALVAMANELSNGLVGTIVQVTPTPIQFADHGSEIQVSAGQVALDVNKHLDARSDLRRDAVVPPVRDDRRRGDGRRPTQHVVHRLGARHEVERPEQALGVLRHVQLLDATGQEGRKGTERQTKQLPACPVLCPSCPVVPLCL